MSPVQESQPAARPRITALVPAHDAVSTLGGTLTSLLTADWPDLEVLVVDDGSSDGTLELARTYESLWPEGNATGRFVRVLSQENGGVSRARNTGFAAMTGDFVAFVDADDQVLPDYFTTAMAAFCADGADPACFDPQRSRRIVVNNAWLLTPSGLTPGRVLLREAMPQPKDQPLRILQDNIAGILSLFPAQLVREIGGFDPDLAVCEDWDLWLRAVRAGWVLVRQNRPTALYRWTGGSASSQRELMYAGQDAVLRKAQAAGGLTAEESAFLEERLREGSPARLVSEAEQAMRAGEVKEAARLMRRAAHFLPTQRRIRVKAWATYVPGGAQLMALRQRQLDAAVGFTEGMQR